MVNLELYKVFYTVAKCGSLTRAAEELYISQPAVSQSIKQLETQLGVSLFNSRIKLLNLIIGKRIQPPCEEIQLVEINRPRIQGRQLQRIMDVLDKEQLGRIRRNLRLYENIV